VAYKTLGELRSELRARLGYSAAGAAAGVNQEVLNNFLQQAQVVLYWTHDWARLRAYSDITIGLDQYLVDYPTNCNPERVKAISIEVNDVWTPPLPKGISPEHYTTQGMTSYPSRWEPYAQIEFWPKADQIYTGRVFYVRNLDPFTQDGHRATIDHDLIFTLALADGKGHYRQPDAANYKARAETLLTQLKAKNWGKTVFNPRDYAEDPIAKPRVV
jgi:hypothetical protein